MYTAYVLDQHSRDILLKKFPPKYPDVIGHHVTVEFGVSKDADAPEEAEIKVIGYVNDPEGLEALVVVVNGNKTRSDGKIYHITWSLDREKFAPKDSNDLIEANKHFLLVMATPISTTPKVLK